MWGRKDLSIKPYKVLQTYVPSDLRLNPPSLNAQSLTR